MTKHIFDEYTRNARYKESDSGKQYIFSNLGRITETDDPDVYDIWLVGPHLNSVPTKKLKAVAALLHPEVLDLTLLDGEATGNCSRTAVAAVAKILQIHKKRRQTHGFKKE